MTKKSDVIKLILDSVKENERLTKSVLGFAIVEAATKSESFFPELNSLKTNAETIIYLVDEIHKHEMLLANMYQKNKISKEEFFTKDELEIEMRQIAGYRENIQKILSDIC